MERTGKSGPPFITTLDFVDASETLAQQYLQARFRKVVYEPDGNISPDFLVDDRIAVEVRRLNENESIAGEHRGLEEVSIPLWNNIKSLLATLGSPTHGQSWYILVRHKRPLGSWRELRPLVSAALTAFRDRARHEPTKVTVTDNLAFVLFRTGKSYPTFFVLGGSSDEDSGGLLLELMEKNIRLCIDQKLHKVAPVRSKYPEWWLLLVDHIGFGLDDFDRELFRDQVTIQHTWDKVILVDPRDASRSFEI